MSLLKSLINLGHKPAAYVDTRDEKNIQKELINCLKKNNIPYYINAEVEGCDGNKEIKQISIRNNKK